MKMMLILLPALMLALCQADLVSAADGTQTPTGEQPAQPAIAADDVAHSIDLIMATFQTKVLAQAKSQAHSLPAYSAWLTAVSDAVRSNELPSTSSGGGSGLDPVHSALLSKGNLADQELASYVAPSPPTHDLEAAAAYGEQTHCVSLGRQLLLDFHDQPEVIRTAAADYLVEKYGP